MSKVLVDTTGHKQKKERRDLTMMAILYDTGARVQELVHLKTSDIRLIIPATITLSGKGNKGRSVPIMKKTQKLLESYMTENNLLKNGNQSHPLFFNSNRRPFTRPGITYILDKYLKRAKEFHTELLFPKKLTPHMIRHTKAMHQLEAE